MNHLAGALVLAGLVTLCGCGTPSARPLEVSAPEGPCGAIVESWPLESAAHVPVGTDITSWQSNPPSSGAHYPAWAAFQEFAAPVPRGYSVHDLEHGGVVLLYNCSRVEGGADGGACAALRQGLREASASLPDDRRCAAPVRVRTVISPDPLLADPVAAAAWGFVWRGQCVDPPSLAAFAAAHYARAPEDECANGVTTF